MLWFRFYNEVLDDPKVQQLDGDLFKAWVNLLCLCSRNGGLPRSVSDISFSLRITETVCLTVLERLSNAGLIDRLNGGVNGVHYAIHGWEKRQFKSDTSTHRVKRYRERYSNATETAIETAPDTDTDTDTEHIKNYIKKPKPIRSITLADSQFNLFWDHYPKRVGRGAAEKAWLKAIKDDNAVTIVDALKAYKFSEDQQFIPHPATWLNQRRWTDQQEVTQKQTGKISETERAERLRLYEEGLKRLHEAAAASRG